MSFNIKNLSGTVVEVNDLGIRLEIGETISLLEETPGDIAISNDLITKINNSEIIVLDPLNGTIALTLSESVEVVQTANDPHYRIRGGSLNQLTDVVSNLNVIVALGDILTYTGTSWTSQSPAIATSIFGGNFQKQESLGVTTTVGTSFINKTTLTTGVLPIGTYRIGLSYGWNHNDKESDFECRLMEDSVQKGQTHKQEPKDSSGSFSSTGTSQKHYTSRTFYSTYASATTHVFDVEFRTDDSGEESSMWDTVIEIWRIS